MQRTLVGFFLVLFLGQNFQSLHVRCAYSWLNFYPLLRYYFSLHPTCPSMMAKSEPLITWNFFQKAFSSQFSHNPIRRASTRFRRARSGRPQALPTRSLDTLSPGLHSDLPTEPQFSPACCLRHSETAAANVENFSPYKTQSAVVSPERWHAHKRTKAGSVTQPLAECCKVYTSELRATSLWRAWLSVRVRV